jgi:hypothetical protein
MGKEGGMGIEMHEVAQGGKGMGYLELDVWKVESTEYGIWRSRRAWTMGVLEKIPRGMSLFGIAEGRNHS